MAEALAEAEVDDADWLRREVEMLGARFDQVTARLQRIEVQQAVNTTKLSIYAGLSGGFAGGGVTWLLDLFRVANGS